MCAVGKIRMSPERGNENGQICRLSVLVFGKMGGVRGGDGVE